MMGRRWMGRGGFQEGLLRTQPLAPVRKLKQNSTGKQSTFFLTSDPTLGRRLTTGKKKKGSGCVSCNLENCFSHFLREFGRTDALID